MGTPIKGSIFWILPGVWVQTILAFRSLEMLKTGEFWVEESNWRAGRMGQLIILLFNVSKNWNS